LAHTRGIAVRPVERNDHEFELDSERPGDALVVMLLRDDLGTHSVEHLLDSERPGDALVVMLLRDDLGTHSVEHLSIGRGFIQGAHNPLGNVASVHKSHQVAPAVDRGDVLALEYAIDRIGATGSISRW